MNRVSLKGVLTGGVVDITLSTIAGLALMVYVGSSPALAAIPLDGRSQAIADLIQQRPAYYLTGLLIGSW